jgi:hypothetical protein
MAKVRLILAGVLLIGCLMRAAVVEGERLA